MFIKHVRIISINLATLIFCYLGFSSLPQLVAKEDSKKDRNLLTESESGSLDNNSSDTTADSKKHKKSKHSKLNESADSLTQDTKDIKDTKESKDIKEPQKVTESKEQEGSKELKDSNKDSHSTKTDDTLSKEKSDAILNEYKQEASDPNAQPSGNSSSKEASSHKDKTSSTAEVKAPFKVDTISTDLSFQLDMVGLTTFISLNSKKLVRTIGSGLSLYYKLKSLSSESNILLYLGYNSFNTYTDRSATEFDLKLQHYLSGVSFQQKVCDSLSILAGINLGVASYKKFYIGSSSKGGASFSPQVMVDFRYDLSFIEHLAMGVKSVYTLGKLSYAQNSIYVGLNF